MKPCILHILALLCLAAAPSSASPICARAIAAATFQVGGDWEGSGLTMEVFEKWLEALPESSATSDRIARVATQYLEEIQGGADRTDVTEWEIAHAINAGLKERTPHDRIEPQQTERARPPQSRVGLGIEYSFHRDAIYIERVALDSESARHGLHLGDQIQQFDGWHVSENGPRTVAMKIALKQFNENEPVKLVVRRGHQHLSFDMKPSPFEPLQSVGVHTVQMKKSLAGVMTLRDFHCVSVERDVARGLDTFRKSNIDGLILDLRGNPGGLVDVVKKVAGYFLGKKKLVIAEEPLSAGVRPAYHFTDSQSRLQVPMLILVDSASASAAEVLAGVLQHYQVAYLVGAPTYGKGSVQSSCSAEGLAFAGLPVTLYATSALYYLPCGRTPQRRGLLPDFEVHQPFPTRSQFVVREQELPNSLAADYTWDFNLPPDPLREWLRNSPRTPQLRLPDGDFQKETALKILSEWIALKNPQG